MQWNTPVIFLETSHIAQFWEELKSKWIIVPWMDEFDKTIELMKKSKPQQWIDFMYLKVDWKNFKQIFEQIQYAIETLIPEKQKKFS